MILRLLLFFGRVPVEGAVVRAVLDGPEFFVEFLNRNLLHARVFGFVPAQGFAEQQACVHVERGRVRVRWQVRARLGLGLRHKGFVISALVHDGASQVFLFVPDMDYYIGERGGWQYE